MANSTKLGLPLVSADQAQKHVTVNQTISELDALVQPSVKSMALSTPPTGVEGECYIVADSPTGAWTDHAKEVAQYLNGSWTFYTPQEGWKTWDESSGIEYLFSLGTWGHPADTVVAESPNGANFGFYILEELITLSGASVDSSIMIPNGAIVFGVTSRVVTEVTGVASYSVGVVGAVQRYGSGISPTAGTTYHGSNDPKTYTEDTAVAVRAITGSFTGGSVRISIHYYLPKLLDT